ncbi:MAG: glycine-rich domain-containing protein, partial [Candidatus Paceibacterota bacterium]
MTSLKSQKGYTLIELLVYTAVFAAAVGVFSGVLITFTRVGTQTSADAELTQQLAYVQSIVRRLVRESANIENPAGVASSSLVLRMTSPAQDPTIISSDANGIYLKQGTGETLAITNNQVKVSGFEVTKYENPEAHAIVRVDLSLTYNSESPYQKITRALKFAIGRVSAATFDDSLVPNTDNSFSLGIASTNRWKDINISNLLNLGQLITDPVAGAQNGSIYYNTASSSFRGYANGVWANLGGVGWEAAGNDIYNTNSGNVGIGINPPTYKLDVTGTFRATGTSTFAGNVGIGTANPTDTLEVNGSIVTTGIQNPGKTTKILTSGTASSKILDYMEYVLDANAQAAYVTDGIVSAVTLDLMEYSSDSSAQASYVTNFVPVSAFSATGGTVTTVGSDKVHTYTTVGNSTFTVTGSGNVQVLVVGGGGGGGSTIIGGGGGAGGLIYNSSSAVTAQTYTVTVGDGGAVDTAGNNSVFNSQTAYGGGAGGAGGAGGNGGSGGGASYGTGGIGSQGYNGGSTEGGGYHGSGGGGGMGGIGGTGLSGGTCGNGGVGLGYDISGSHVHYAGGGGGGRNYDGFPPIGVGNDGGGNGASNSVAATVGTANRGGGGGGGGPASTGAKGGSGIVIIRYTPVPAVGGLQSYSEATI